MQLKRSKFSAFASGRCPKCREGKVFKYMALHSRFGVMHEYCPVCGFRFEIEPGFFWGSMYISYALTVAVAIPTSVAIYYFMDDPEGWVYMAVILAILAVFSPIMFRFSRLIMLHYFGQVEYDPNAAKK